LKLHFDYLELELGQHDWFVGSTFGAADIQMSFPVEASATRLDYHERPNLQRFLDATNRRNEDGRQEGRRRQATQAAQPGLVRCAG
jgi:glutathione S-transferase